jgi:hypothetical protein
VVDGVEQEGFVVALKDDHAEHVVEIFYVPDQFEPVTGAS